MNYNQNDRAQRYNSNKSDSKEVTSRTILNNSWYKCARIDRSGRIWKRRCDGGGGDDIDLVVICCIHSESQPHVRCKGHVVATLRKISRINLKKKAHVLVKVISLFDSLNSHCRAWDGHSWVIVSQGLWLRWQFTHWWECRLCLADHSQTFEAKKRRQIEARKQKYQKNDEMRRWRNVMLDSRPASATLGHYKLQCAAHCHWKTTHQWTIQREGQ